MPGSLLLPFACAQAVFAGLGIALLSGVCTPVGPWQPSVNRNGVGLEYISEKLMHCNHSPRGLDYLPLLMSVAFSVVVMQLLETWRLLYRRKSAVHDALFTACGVLCLVGWCVLVRYDHRDRRDAFSGMDGMHAAGVVVFMASFIALHAASSWAYAEDIVSVNLTHFAIFRREAYVASDVLYVIVCVVFAVLVILDRNSGAITAEYIILLAFEILNIANIYILSRLETRAAPALKAAGSSVETDEYVVTLTITR